MYIENIRIQMIQQLVTGLTELIKTKISPDGVKLECKCIK